MSNQDNGPELTTRSIIVGLIVALIIGSAYPYCVLKLGFGPNLSVVSAFLGFIALVLILRAAGTNARENNIVQTMGTSAGQTAFMAVLLAAFDMLNARGIFNPPIQLGTWQIFFWLCSASLLGILLAVPMRRHYIDEENLTYADGLAAGETIKVLHEGRDKGASAGPVKALALGSLASGLLMFVTSFLKWIRDTWYLPGMQPMNIGFNWSLLSFGSGLLVLLCDGPRHGDQLVLPASLSPETGNDSRADISGDVALGDVARDRLDGGWRPHLTRAEVESNRQDVSWFEGEPDRPH